MCCWFLEQAAQCSSRLVKVLFVFPEDLGGDAESGPSSLWDFLEVRAVDGVNDIQRGAAYHCQFAGSNQRRPLGLYTNLSSLQSSMHRGWPSLFHLGSDLHYDGPLPPSCPCLSTHVPLKGVDSREEFQLLIFLGWASSSGGCVWSLSWILETLPLGLESQLTQCIPARGFRQSLSGIPSAHLFLPFLLPHRRCTGYSRTGEKAICHDRFSLITWVQMWQRNISLEPLRPRTGLVRRSALLSWGRGGGGAFIGEYIIKHNRKYSSPRGHGGTHGGSPRGATTAGFFGSLSPRHVVSGDPGNSTVSPSQFSGQSGLPTDVSRNVRDVRSPLL